VVLPYHKEKLGLGGKVWGVINWVGSKFVPSWNEWHTDMFFETTITITVIDEVGRLEGKDLLPYDLHRRLTTMQTT